MARTYSVALVVAALVAAGCSRQPTSAPKKEEPLTGPGGLVVANASAAPSGAKVFAKGARVACNALPADFRFPPVSATDFNAGECRTH